MSQGFANASHRENLLEEVQHLCSGTSDRLVQEPTQRSVQADMLIAIRHFKNLVRRKELWCKKKQSTKTELNEEIGESRFMASGLSTGLKTMFFLKTDKHRFDNIEGFLTAF